MLMRTPASISSSRTQRTLFALSLLVPAGLLAGCGLGTASSPSNMLLSGIHGTAMGGQSPIQAATIRYYATSSSATDYGQAAILLGTSTTDANGNFSITPTVGCSAGQQVYITSAGGYQNSAAPTTANTTTLEMAALGPCGTLSTAAYKNGLVINEVTSVAAAYALSNFMTTTLGSDGLYVANVSAPAANNSLPGAITATAPAGLTHAFLNAANLASPANPSSTTAGGTANQSFTVNVGGTAMTATVPANEINTLADMMAACVNGATANSQCTSLYSLTPSISGVAPANTLQSFVNLARNPYPSAAALGSGTGSLLGLVNAQSPFQNVLTAAPMTDYSLSIVYGKTVLPLAYYIALDANDTLYAGLATTAPTSATTPLPALFALSTYGVATPSAPFDSFSAGTATRGVAPDSLGNVFVANSGSILGRFSATTGAELSEITAPQSSTYGVAVDKQNNVWLANAVASTTTANITQYTQASAYTAAKSATTAFGIYGLTVDNNQNVWAAGYLTSGTMAYEIVNTGNAAAPVYSTGATVTPITAMFASTTPKPYSVVMDATGNAWFALTGTPSTTTTGINEVIPNAYLGATTLAPQTFIPNTTAGNQSNTLGTLSPQYMAIDGANTIFTAENQGGGSTGVHAYLIQAGAGGNHILSSTKGFLSCYLPSATPTVCGSGTTAASSAAIYNTRGPVVDSTGSLWTGETGGGIAQTIGIAAPAFPLLSAGQQGLAPGRTTVMPLP